NLYLDNNQIADVSSLSSLGNLTNLTLNNNQIVDVSSLSSLTNLTELVLRGNQIENRICPLEEKERSVCWFGD
ncbi:MAG: leucine-rich repeat domain-containing protein, partial [Oscillatoria sp. PMC 1068.18]|nr:leucine-rich repeat domain-containing protein [Oscillatoria sp. PMC 1076.18]MEC4991027.1 leucine-rich repeat domain-containing protein [Oscillatoria sp. PMC 1068.18]